MRKIGIMGGTFNPIHIGHLLLAECAGEEFSLDEVWFIPTGHSYMKEAIDSENTKTPTSMERFEMTKLAVETNPLFCCVDIEVKRKGNTYTYETLEELKERFPDAVFYFIMGADSLFKIESWKNPERVFAACEIIAAVREEFAPKDVQEEIQLLCAKYRANIHFLPFYELALSSTDIRKRVGEGKSIRYMVPDNVRRYIEEKGFYNA